MKKSDNYASNQIRILLNDLKNPSHKIKIKAIETFQAYIETYQPDIADENVDILFNGTSEDKTSGLLYWSGVKSEKHQGELKRICTPTLSLLRWLVCHESESERGNFYYTRFIQLPLSKLKLIDFPKHVILYKPKKSKKHNIDDAFVLITILMDDHRSMEGKVSRIELDDLLAYNEICHKKFDEWMEANDTNQRFSKRRGEDALDRPVIWEEVNFKCLPLQEGEEDVEEDSVEPVVHLHIPDPLGISSVDLRSVQNLYNSGRLLKSESGSYGRRNTNAFIVPVSLEYKNNNTNNKQAGNETTKHRDSVFSAYAPTNTTDADEASSSDDSDSDGEQPGTSGIVAGDSNNNSQLMKTNTNGNQMEGRLRKAIPSVVPSDRSFSTALYLTLVHGSISFNQLKTGLLHLQESLTQQSSRRENLVRMHFGLFVQCAEGLDFLKAYRKGAFKGNDNFNRRNSEFDKKTRKNRNSIENFSGNMMESDKGLERLKNSKSTLDVAKIEAQRTLAPILERMKKSRRIKSAEKVLKKMTGILEYPLRMRLALERGDYQEVVSIYKRLILAVESGNSSLRILQKIKEAGVNVINELKKLCFSHLLSPNSNYSALLKYAQIWLELEGEGPYQEILRNCFIRQVLHVIEKMKEIRDKFCADCTDANDRGLEQNLMSKSPFLFGISNERATQNEKETVASIMKRHTQAAHTKHNRRHHQHLANKASKHNRRRINSEHSEIGLDKTNNNWDVDSEGEYGEEYFDPNEDLDHNPMDDEDEFDIDGELSDGDWLDDDDENEEDNAINEFYQGLHTQTTTAISDQLVSSSSNANNRDDEDDRNDAVDESRTNQEVAKSTFAELNHSLLLCSLVRQEYVENMTDLLSKWFPCLFKLVQAMSSSNSFNTTGHHNHNNNLPAQLLTHQSTRSIDAMSTPGREKLKGISANTIIGLGTPGNAITNNSNNNSSNAGYLHMHRGITAPSRILGEVLKLHSDFVKQAIVGLENSFTALELQAELVTAFNELDNYLSSATLSSTVPSVSTTVSTLNQSGLYYDNKIFNVLVSTLLFQPLREPFHRDSLQEVFDLYDGMEYLFNQEISILQQQQQLQNPSQYIDETRGIISSLGPLFGSSATNLSMTHQNRPATSSANSKSLGNLNFRSLTSPYYDAMNTLQLLSKEGEVSLAQKILDRLLELSQQLDMRRNSASNMMSNNETATSSIHYLPSNDISRNSMNKNLYLNVNKKNTTTNKEIEDSVVDLCNLVLRCLKSLTFKVKREEWVAATVQDNLQKVLSLFLLSLNNYVEQESTTHSTITYNSDIVMSLHNNNSSNMIGEVPYSPKHKAGVTSITTMNEKREQDLTHSAISNQLHKRAMKHVGIGAAKGHNPWLDLHSFDDELKFAEIDDLNAALQIRLLRACLYLRSHAVPIMYQAVKKAFPLPDDLYEDHQQHAISTSTTTNIGEIDHKNITKTTLFTDSTDLTNKHSNKPNGSKQLSGMKQQTSLLSTLFSNDIDDSDNTTTNASIASKDNLHNNLSYQSGGATATAVVSGGGDAVINSKAKLSLYDIMQSILNTMNYGLFTQNQKEIINAEHRAAISYIRIKEKQLRNCLFSNYALFIHKEFSKQWLPLNKSHIPIHLSRILLTLGKEKDSIREILGDATIDAGDTTTTATIIIDNDQDMKKKKPYRKFFEGLLYRDHLYKKLCQSILDIYMDLIHRLYKNTFTGQTITEVSEVTKNKRQSTTTAPGKVNVRSSVHQNMKTSKDIKNSDDEDDKSTFSTSVTKTPLSLGQAIEEYKFLKNMLEPLLFADISIDYNNPSTANIHCGKPFHIDKYQVIGRRGKNLMEDIDKMYPSSKQLELYSKMFSMMICNTSSTLDQ